MTIPDVPRPTWQRRVAIATALAVLTSYLGFLYPPIASAATVQNPTSVCATAAFRALVYENQDYAGDALWVCASIPNLDAVAHTLNTDCKSVVLKFSDTWNDCISSVKWWMPANKRLQFFSESGYGGVSWEVNTCGRSGSVSGANLPVLPGDYVSSIRFLSC